VSEYIDWQHLPRIDFSRRFQDVNGTAGSRFFEKMGITIALPPSIRFDANLFHPETAGNIPSIVIAFQDMQSNLRGVLVRYIGSSAYYLSETSEPLQKKYFYGNATNASAIIRSGNNAEVIISDFMTALWIREALARDKTKKLLLIYN
jgi:hypothetical protein